jgi:formylglycine-generating enzyme required for sulfatase activity
VGANYKDEQLMTVIKSDFCALEQLEQWLSLSEDEQDAVVRDLEEQLRGEYVHQYTLSYTNQPSFRVPTFRHQQTGLEFNFIIGGQFNMGFSAQEEAAVKRLMNGKKLYLDTFDFMRPVHSVQVQPFLISRFPLLNNFAQEHLALYSDDFISDFAEKETDIVPASLTRERIEVLLEKFGFHLPSEAQWEYAYRGGTTTLFYWGDEIPSDEVLEQKILLYEFSDSEKCKAAANPFGLVGISVGEWCEDSYRPDYTKASENELPVIKQPLYVVRGGAAMAWPWQEGDEWIMCMSAMREKSEFDLPLAGRFVKVIDLY